MSMSMNKRVQQNYQIEPSERRYTLQLKGYPRVGKLLFLHISILNSTIPFNNTTEIEPPLAYVFCIQEAAL